MVHPSHYIAQHALHVVIELPLDLFLTQLTAIIEWNRQDVIDAAPVIAFERCLDARNRKVVVVRGV